MLGKFICTLAWPLPSGAALANIVIIALLSLRRTVTAESGQRRRFGHGADALDGAR